jgi:predicted HAD superfamily Cof-like phosphohydrolase
MENTLEQPNGLEQAYDLGFKHGEAHYLNQLEKFQTAFNSTYNETPTLLLDNEWLLRHELLNEELTEYFIACENGDKVGILDALVDIEYVLKGTIVSHGMQNVFNEAFRRVHENNMSKLVDGKPLINEVGSEHYDPSKPIGKVLKPKGYVSVDLSDLV